MPTTLTLDVDLADWGITLPPGAVIESVEVRYLYDVKHLPGQHSQQSHGTGGGGSGEGRGARQTARVGEMSEAIYDAKSKRWTLADGSAMPKHVPRLPPAWRDVRVSLNPKADLVARGVDAKGRTQSVYSQSYQTRQAAKKFARTNELREKFAKIEREVARDLESPDPRTREDAHVLRLIMHTGIRPGGEGNTRAAKKAYGATTLEARHVRVSPKGRVQLKFTGKKGVDLSIDVTDAAIAGDLVARKNGAASPRDKIFDTNPARLGKYSNSRDGGGFKTKDFRTAKGTSIAVEAVKAVKRAPRSEAEYKRMVREVAKKVSAQLGNTPTVALQSYIDPHVFAPWRGAIEGGSKKKKNRVET